MKRNYYDVLNDIKHRLDDVMNVINIFNRDKLTVIVPYKDFKILETIGEIYVYDRNPNEENAKVLGLNCVPADVKRIYICLE